MMDTLPKDQKLIDLLTKLKHTPNGYPSSMLEARRQMYLKQVANVGLGLGAGAVVQHAGKGNGAGSAAAGGSKILEIALIAAIAIEAGAVTYLYRDQIAAFLGLIEPTPVVATQPAFNPSMPETVGELQTPLADASATPSALPTETPAPEQAGENGPTGANNGTSGNDVNSSNSSNNNASSSDSNNPASINANATPNPGGNQGNQYGLTPKPERTKENSGGGNNNGGNNPGGNNGGGNNNGGGKKDK
jgi:hypothetical protein